MFCILYFASSLFEFWVFWIKFNITVAGCRISFWLIVGLKYLDILLEFTFCVKILPGSFECEYIWVTTQILSIFAWICFEWMPFLLLLGFTTRHACRPSVMSPEPNNVLLALLLRSPSFHPYATLLPPLSHPLTPPLHPTLFCQQVMLTVFTKVLSESQL